MARLDGPDTVRTAGGVLQIDPVPASQQFAAIAWLRWRLFANAFRRKGGKGELIARIIVYPIAFGFLILIVVIAGAAGFFAAQSQHLARLDVVFLGITIFQLVVSINVSPPTLSFDPLSLIRFPVKFSSFLLIRLMLGLMSASTIVGTCALLAAATGVTVAMPPLWLPVFAAALALAVTNMLFVRMVFAWVDRWLSTRRAREVLTGLIFAFSIGIQYLNITINNIGHHSTRAAQRAKLLAAEHAYRAVEGYVRYLPSGRAATAVIAGQYGATGRVLLELALVLAYAAVFLTIFGLRVHREYRGEDLSEGTLSPPAQTPTVQTTSAQTLSAQSARPSPRAELRTAPATLAAAYDQAPARGFAGLSPDVLACMSKEWIYVRRNTAQIYSTLAPLAMVLLFAGRLGSLSRTGYSYPLAVGYALLGTSALSYNSFGLDGTGIQFYFLAPVRMRSVVLAKNLFGFSVTVLQLVLVYLFMLVSRGAVPPWIAVSTLLWAAMTALTNATVGNIRSLRAPKKMDPGKLQRRQGSALSGLMALGVVLLLAAFGLGLFAWAAFSEVAWIPAPFLAAGALAALWFYLRGLNQIDRVALDGREILIEQLAKAS